MTSLRDLPMVIGGQSVVAGRTIENLDPSTAATLCLVSDASPAEVGAAVGAAADAAAGWAAKTPAERGTLLRSLADRIRDQLVELARLETLDTGKPLSQGTADVQVAARYFEYYGCTIEAFEGTSIPLGPDALALTEDVPYGVTGHVIPWNYPAQITARSIAPALAAGNAVVVKPAEIAPITPVRIAELALEAGFPAGVLNVVPGLGAVAGSALVEDPRIGHVSFTGSVATGRAVAAACAARGRPSTLELGGKSPHVVLPGADLEKIAPRILATLIQNAGQTCVAGTRAIVHASLHSELLERLAALIGEVRIGAGLDDPDLGPVISATQLERIEGFVARASESVGAPVISQPAPDDLTGFFIGTQVFDEVAADSELAQSEVFGPVLALTKFESEEEAVATANATPYGLTAAVWSGDMTMALRVARGIEAGQVYLNGYAAGGGVELPFGGFKDSGFGREKGLAALRECTQTRTLMLRSGE